jgi:hypothetical protein
VRCLQKTLSIGIMEAGSDPKPVEKGDLFLMKFRVDSLPVVETGGLAICDWLVQVITEKSLVKYIRDGKETAVRVEDKNGVSSLRIVRAIIFHPFYKEKATKTAGLDLSKRPRATSAPSERCR